jgi:LDH2 family malate/lactate/ureidoglycolate dehydrogenase
LPAQFDMATSAIALFGVLTAQAQGLPLPDNVAYRADGTMTTDASEALGGGGAIATFGGHKGAGLSLCVELLAGALSGGAVLGQVPSKKVAKASIVLVSRIDDTRWSILTLFTLYFWLELGAYVYCDPPRCLCR